MAGIRHPSPAVALHFPAWSRAEEGKLEQRDVVMIARRRSTERVREFIGRTKRREGERRGGTVLDKSEEIAETLVAPEPQIASCTRITIAASHDRDHLTWVNLTSPYRRTSIPSISLPQSIHAAGKVPSLRPGLLSSLTHHLQPSPQNPHPLGRSERSPRPRRHNPRPQPSTSKHVLVALYPLESRHSEIKIQSLILLTLLIPHVHTGNARSPSQEQGPLRLD
jgi:hypothetical protein